MYTQRKPGIVITSGKITDTIPEHGIVKLQFSKWDGLQKKEVTSQTTLDLPGVDLTNVKVGDDVTIVTGPDQNQCFVLKDGETAKIKTGTYTSKRDGKEVDQGVSVIRGRLTYAAYKDEVGNMKQDGSPKKEHYDLLINAGGKTHKISIYNSGKYNEDAIQKAQAKYDGIDFKNNIVRGTFITSLPSGEYEYEKYGHQQTTVSYFGISNPKSDDLTIAPKERTQEQSFHAEAEQEVEPEIPQEMDASEEMVFN